MKIAIDISPIDSNSTSQHKVRGVGKYISLLKDNLEKYDKNNSYIFTNNPQEVRGEVDIIHYPYFDPFFITLPFKNKTKTIVTVHDVTPLVHKRQFPVGVKGTLKWKINKHLLKHVAGVITDSKASKEDINKVTGIRLDKIFPVYLAVDEEFRKLQTTRLASTSDSESRRANYKLQTESKYGLPDNFILYVGDVTWNKNLPRLVAAVKQVKIPLVMVGKALIDEYDKKNPWNSDRNIVLNEIADDPLFIRLGYVPTEDLVEVYNLATALCMPSLDEGFGLPVLEAMKSGCPVITSKNGSLAEVCGDSALYVDAENIDSISDGITQMLENKTLREELSNKGLIQAEKFSLKKMIEDTVEVYNLFNSNAKKN